MATPSQITANQTNSKKSTGPQTAEGKARASLNHLSHGFASNTFRLMPGEDPEEFKALLADFMSEHQPATPTEQVFVERMVRYEWLSLRAFRLQNEAFELAMVRQKPVNNNLELFIRYQNSADRAFHKAHTELVKAQKERKKSEIGSEPLDTAQPQSKTATAAAAKAVFPAHPIPSTAPRPVDELKTAPEAPNSNRSVLENAA